MPNDKNRLHILMVCPLPYVGSIAFVMESIVALADRGYRVDVLVSDDTVPAFQCDHPHVRTFTFRDRAMRRGMQYFELFKRARVLAAKERYDLTIGLSQSGLIVSAWLKKRFGIPCLSYNDEIRFGNERRSLIGNIFGYTMKLLERRANREVIFTVTQDYERGHLLSKTNRISMDSIRFLPNSRMGRAQVSESTYMHERFGFPPDAIIVLWMGMARPRDGALELAREAVDWPKGYRMVFHVRTDRPTPYVRQLMEYHGEGQTYVSSKPIPYEEVGDMAGSATVGLGVYADEGVNTRYMGFSSGKINTYLKAGVPTIARNFEGLRWVEASGAGLCVEDTSGVFEAVKQIVANYRTFQMKSIEAFDSLLSFDNAFTAIIEETVRSLE